ncbi:Dopamine receptor 4 [Schistosoma japonicum]|uniref:Dopamine receptor 4 n=1 Tax=Schistosoma japonicum TaxID=6182 RepID=A0A4Z2DXJ2_SCHJA|nr:Dopamine receptor 4 [Schistosoma japonicum]
MEAGNYFYVDLFNSNNSNNFSEQIHLRNSAAVKSITLLGFIIIITVTIGGNLLVLVAISTKHKLRRNVTNCFIASLAAADLLLGAIVMPFAVIDLLRSIYKECLPKEQQDQYVIWPFGQAWCDTWHAFDVLSSTASILNLCAISVERYVAISDPFNYPLRVTHSRCILMIMLTWVCSILISFPAIAWWRYSSNMYNVSNIISVSNTECLFSSDRLYLFISSCISFHIPLIVMIFVYWKIYQKANGLLKTLNTGRRLIYRKSLGGEAMILRVHRGGTTKTLPSVLHERILPQDSNATIKLSSSCSRDMLRKQPPVLCSAEDDNNINNQEILRCKIDEDKSLKKRVKFNQRNITESVDKNSTYSTLFCGCYKFVFSRLNVNMSMMQNDDILTASTVTQNTDESLISSRNYLNEIKKRVQRFTKERKAAKTLGIVMGVFVLCWLPFFVYNTIKAVYPSILETQENIIFPFVTWLGYLNSGVNPFIYAYSLRDIRKAFLDILCTPCKLHSEWCKNTVQQTRESQYIDEPAEVIKSTNFQSTISFANGSISKVDNAYSTIPMSSLLQEDSYFERDLYGNSLQNKIYNESDTTKQRIPSNTESTTVPESFTQNLSVK